MIFFKISNNLNIKLSDGTLVAYKRFSKKENRIDENIYCTTYDDFKNIENICAGIKEALYRCVLVNMNYFHKYTNDSQQFPKKLGIDYKNEHFAILKCEKNMRTSILVSKAKNNKILNALLEENETKLETIKLPKDKLNLAIIGASYNNLGEIINFCSAVRLLYEELKKKSKNVKIDVCLQGSGNSYYKRDKEIYDSYPFINEVRPLSLSIKELCEYDYYIDTSSIEKSIYYHELPYIDHFLQHFGIDFTKIDSNRKFNEINLKDYKIDSKLEEKIKELKSKSKLLLFHPYSADASRSIPVEVSKKLVNKFTENPSQYQVVTALKMSGLKNDNVLDLSSYSKNFFDFVYIISQVDFVLSVDTATYHISDALFVPTIVLFVDEDLIDIRVKYYNYVRAKYIKQETKSLSKFIFKDDSFHAKSQDSWLDIKANKIMKLLEKI